jgi:hypothetical protein
MRIIDADVMMEALGEFKLFDFVGLDDDDNVNAQLTPIAAMSIAIYGEEAFMEKAAKRIYSQSALALLRTIVYEANIKKIPTLTADDYFDAVDRIKPCPNCRYTLLGALTEDVPRWIPVTERLPDVRKGESECLVYSDVIGVKSGLYIPQWGGFYDGTGKDGDLFVTHWMPLPSMEGLDG